MEIMEGFLNRVRGLETKGLRRVFNQWLPTWNIHCAGNDVVQDAIEAHHGFLPGASADQFEDCKKALECLHPAFFYMLVERKNPEGCPGPMDFSSYKPKPVPSSLWRLTLGVPFWSCVFKVEAKKEKLVAELAKKAAGGRAGQAELEEKRKGK